IRVIHGIWKTFPRAVALLLGFVLNRKTGIEDDRLTTAKTAEMLQGFADFFQSDNPAQFVEDLHAREDAVAAPADFTFDIYDAQATPVHPSQTRFQPIKDLLGW